MWNLKTKRTSNKQNPTHKYREQIDGRQKGGGEARLPAKWVKGNGRYKPPVMEGNHGDERHGPGIIVNETVTACVVTDGNYTCGEHSLTYGFVKSLCCTPETNATFCQLGSKL